MVLRISAVLALGFCSVCAAVAQDVFVYDFAAKSVTSDPWHKSTVGAHRFMSAKPLTYDVYKRTSVIFRITSANPFHYRYAVNLPAYQGERLQAQAALNAPLAIIDTPSADLKAIVCPPGKAVDDSAVAKGTTDITKYNEALATLQHFIAIRTSYQAFLSDLRNSSDVNGFRTCLSIFAKNCNIADAAFEPNAPRDWGTTFMKGVPNDELVSKLSDALTALKHDFNQTTNVGGKADPLGMPPTVARWFDKNSEAVDSLRMQYPIARTELGEQLARVLDCSIIEFDAQVWETPVEVYVKTDPVSRPLTAVPPDPKDASLILRPARRTRGITVGLALDSISGNDITPIPFRGDFAQNRRNQPLAVALLYHDQFRTTLSSTTTGYGFGVGLKPREPIHYYAGLSLLRGYPWRIAFTAGLVAGSVRSGTLIPGIRGAGFVSIKNEWNLGFFLPSPSVSKLRAG